MPVSKIFRVIYFYASGLALIGYGTWELLPAGEPAWWATILVIGNAIVAGLVGKELVKPEI